MEKASKIQFKTIPILKRFRYIRVSVPARNPYADHFALQQCVMCKIKIKSFFSIKD